MNPAFEYCIKCLLEHEGGFVDHPDDRGGPTNYGITINSFSQYIKHKATVQELKNLNLAQVYGFYKSEFWDAMHLDDIGDLRLQMVLFDQAVNRGIGPAVKNMNLVVTGTTDSTLDYNQINKVDPLLTSIKYICVAQNSYVSIVKKNQSQLVFLSGWIARTHQLLERVVSLEQMVDQEIQ